MAKRRARAGADRDAERDTRAAELYVGAFDDFVSRRNELAGELRAGGDEQAAERVRALKKPTRVAWAIDRLSSLEQELRDELLAAGAALRGAQEQLLAGKATSAEVREAAQLERAAVAKALDAATALARDAGVDLSQAGLDRARQTLHAVALDEDVRRDFERHRLTTDHAAAGLGGLSQGAVPARKSAGQGRSGADEAKQRRDELKTAEDQAQKLEQRRRDAERDAHAAREAAERARADLKRAAKQLDDATAEEAAAHERVDALRKRLK